MGCEGGGGSPRNSKSKIDIRPPRLSSTLAWSLGSYLLGRSWSLLTASVSIRRTTIASSGVTRMTLISWMTPRVGPHTYSIPWWPPQYTKEFLGSKVSRSTLKRKITECSSTAYCRSSLGIFQARGWSSSKTMQVSSIAMPSIFILARGFKSGTTRYQQFFTKNGLGQT